MTEDKSNIIDFTKYLNAKSSPDETHSALEKLAESDADPLTQDQFLRAVSEQTGAGLRSVRQTYEIVRKKLKLAPIDIGLSVSKELLDIFYAGGAELSLSQDGTLFSYTGTHWETVSPQRIRGELQDIAIKYKALTKRSILSIVSEAFGTLKDRLGQQGCVLSLQGEIRPVINFKNGELWLGSDGSVELKAHQPESQLLYCLPYEYDEAAIFGGNDRQSAPESPFIHLP